MEEQWKVIPDFPFYEVGDQGHVRSYRSRKGFRRIEPILLSPVIGRTGYEVVALTGDNLKISQKSVGRLVAEAFVPNPGQSKKISYIDGNILNNRANNLMWGQKVRKKND